MGFTNIDELTMTDTEFQKFKKIIYEQVGINLLPHKKIMLQGRIKKRLKDSSETITHEELLKELGL